MVDCSPQHYLPNIIKIMKGVPARLLMQQYSSILKYRLWGGHLWSHSYYMGTVGNMSKETVEKLLKDLSTACKEYQEEKDKHGNN